jgi:hypothetical protein
VQEAADCFQVSNGKAYYWRQKVLLPNFHPNQHGGFRIETCVLHPKDRKVVENYLWGVVNSNKCSSAAEMQEGLRQLGFNVNKTYIYRFLQQWEWKKRKMRANRLKKSAATDR